MLSQSEIDALLGAVGTTDPAGDPGPIGTGAVGPIATTRPVKVYDFRRPDKFSKDQLRTLQAVHENVARVAAARMSARLRSAVTITLADTAQMIFDEYVAQLVLPTQLVVLRADELAGPFVIDFDLALAFGAIDRLLGGPGRIPAERREPTRIEASLIERITDDIVPAIAEGWAHLQPMRIDVSERALGPSLLRIAAPSHVVAVLTYEVRIGGQTAPLTICYPHATLEPLLSRLSATAWYAEPDRSADNGGGRADLAAALQVVEIPVTAILGGVELSVEALMGLQPGDVIRFEDRADAPLRLEIMDQATAWGRPGRSGDRVAIQLITPLEPAEASA